MTASSVVLVSALATALAWSLWVLRALKTGKRTTVWWAGLLAESILGGIIFLLVDSAKDRVSGGTPPPTPTTPVSAPKRDNIRQQSQPADDTIQRPASNSRSDTGITAPVVIRPQVSHSERVVVDLSLNGDQTTSDLSAYVESEITSLVSKIENDSTINESWRLRVNLTVTDLQASYGGEPIATASIRWAMVDKTNRSLGTQSILDQRSTGVDLVSARAGAVTRAVKIELPEIQRSLLTLRRSRSPSRR